MQRWVESDFLSLDTETTGVNVDTDRVVTASLLRVPPGSLVASQTWEWVVDPGVEIPAEASEVHGWTTERAREEGVNPAKAIRELVDVLAKEWDPMTPLVVCNAPYDLSLLDAESRRHLGDPLRLTGYVLDPMVCDRELDKYRRGSRKLTALCGHYGVTLDQAHASTADALAGVGVMRAVIEAYPNVGQRSLAELHHFQKTWRKRWADGYQSYLRSSARRDRTPESEIQKIVIDQSWPMKTPASIGA